MRRDRVSFIHPSAKVDASIYRFSSHVYEGAVVEKPNYLFCCDIGEYSTIAKGCLVTFDVPPHSYVEPIKNVGNGHLVHIVYTPDGILVKPGCMRLEPIEKTLKRLATPKRIRQYVKLSDGTKEKYAQEWIKVLTKAQKYTVT
jgi:hypothetical protein